MKYDVYAKVIATKHIGTFIADSKEAAENMAAESVGCDSISLCHECARKIDEPTITGFEAEERE